MKKIAMRVGIVTIILNTVLSAVKLFAGISGNSEAMISDAVHSISDVLSTIVVMIGISISRRQSDKGHPYGHERFECVAALILSVMLFLTGAALGISSMEKIISGTATGEPELRALLAAVVSIIVKEWMYRYTRKAAVKVNSGALMADAWHHRSDALSSVGSFAGILGARLGLPVLDSVAGILICVLIIKASVEIFMDAVNKMIDKSCDEDMEKEIASTVMQNESVLGIDRMKTRLFGDKIYVDLEIQMDGSKSLYEAHGIDHGLHDAVETGFPLVKHCMIHVNPTQDGIL